MVNDQRDKELERLEEGLKELEEAKGRMFPYDVDISDRGKQFRREQLTLRVYAEDPPFPEELFQALDLHGQSRGRKNFVGWVNAWFAPGDEDKGKASVLAVTEVQADVIQRTVYFTSKERYQEKIMARIEKTWNEYKRIKREYEEIQNRLAKIDKPARDPEAGELLKQKLGSEEEYVRLEELREYLSQLFKKYENQLRLYPQFADYKSKVENYFARWMEAFANAALNEAKRRGAKLFMIASSELIQEIAVQAPDPALFKRIYDNTAQKMGLVQKNVGDPTRGGRKSIYWVNWTEKVKIFENKLDSSYSLTEEVPPQQWDTHLSTFLRTFTQHLGRDDDDAIREAFSYWVEELQTELKFNEDFKREVERHMFEVYRIDVSDLWGGPDLGPGLGDDDTDCASFVEVLGPDFGSELSTDPGGVGDRELELMYAEHLDRARKDIPRFLSGISELKEGVLGTGAGKSMPFSGLSESSTMESIVEQAMSEKEDKFTGRCPECGSIEVKPVSRSNPDLVTCKNCGETGDKKNFKGSVSEDILVEQENLCCPMCEKNDIRGVEKDDNLGRIVVECASCSHRGPINWFRGK